MVKFRVTVWTRTNLKPKPNPKPYSNPDCNLKLTLLYIQTSFLFLIGRHSPVNS